MPLIEPCNSVVLKEKVLAQLSLRKSMVPCFGTVVSLARKEKENDVKTHRCFVK